MISIAVFEPKDRDRKPTVAELVCLKAFADSSYVTESHPQLLLPSEQGALEYIFRLSSIGELNSEPQKLINQGVQRLSGTTTAIIAEIEPVEDGGFNLTMNFREGTEEPREANERSAFVAMPSAGTIVLANGMIASWSTRLKE